MDEPTTPKKTRERSPGYPGISLETALQRVEAVYQRERRNPTPVNVLLEHWGYAPGSGPGLVTLAALKKFGLMEDIGSGAGRRAKLSDDAAKIILDQREDSTERRALIRTLALRPAIHREVWEKFGGALPSDANLRHYLIFDRSFTDVGAAEFVRQFRATVEFAGLSEADRLSPVSSPALQTDGLSTPMIEAIPMLGTNQPAAHTMPLPIAPGEYAHLVAAFPLTEAKWQQMLAVLAVMKPALVVGAEKHDAKPEPRTESQADPDAESAEA
jgi:hypothetical protein